jgi:predicted phosphodiesterase
VRILLLSDIHGNLEALEACLKAAPAYDAVANLGDLVGYGASPNEVVERARGLDGLWVRGNHDKACSGISSIEDFNPVAGMAALWTRTMLTPENNAWLRELPAGPVTMKELTNVGFVHGSPLDEDEYVLSVRGAMECLQGAESAITFFGHTHIQGGFMLEDESPSALLPRYEGGAMERFELPLRRGARYLINPGSVGQPRDSDWRAAFAVFDSDAPSITWFRVPYPVETAQKRIRNAGLPERLAARLSVGR